MLWDCMVHIYSKIGDQKILVLASFLRNTFKNIKTTKLTLSKACSIVMVMKCKFLRVLKHTFKYTLWNVEKAFIYSTTGRTQHLR